MSHQKSSLLSLVVYIFETSCLFSIGALHAHTNQEDSLKYLKFTHSYSISLKGLQSIPGFQKLQTEKNSCLDLMTGFSTSFKEDCESTEIDGEGADISHFICMV